VAMTILVLDLRIPDEFHPIDQVALTLALVGLWPKFFPYVLSFYILGSTWLANIKLRSHGEFLDKRYVSWWLTYLLLATCLRSLVASHVMGPQCGCIRSTWRLWQLLNIDWSFCYPMSKMTNKRSIAKYFLFS
jgi:uncharacterized membrane protein